MNMARYAAAEALEGNGAYEAAAKAFDAITGYEDADSRAEECRYALAVQEKEAGRYAEAAKIFAVLGEREDSAELAKECRYLLAGQYAEKGLWEDAISLYEALDGYSESKAKCAECRLGLGWKQMEDGKAEEAYQSFGAAGDTAAQQQAAFAAGEKYTAAYQLEEALRWYSMAPDLTETQERAAMIARSLLDMEEDTLSESWASLAPNSEKARDVLYALALRSLERKDEEAAMRQMKKAGDNADASERFQAMLSARVDALVAEERFDDAVFLCSTYGEQEKADGILALKAEKEEEERRKAEEAEKAAREAKKAEADALLEAGQYDEAAALYTEIGEKELAKSALNAKAEAEAAQLAEEEAARAEAEKAEAEERRKTEEAEKATLEAKKAEADALLEAGQYDEAMAAYRELGETEMASEAVYRKADALRLPDLYLQIPE